MKLYDEEELRIKNEKSKKIKDLILVGIIFSIVLIVLLMGGIYYLIYNPNKITINVNGKEDEEIENMIITKNADDGSTIVYFPIRKISNKFGYTSNSGDYERNVENTENCYVESENEVAIFTENSNIIYKIDKSVQNNNSDYDYEEISIDNFIIKENNALYVDSEGLRKAFNLHMKTNSRMKRINITTLDTMIKSAETKIKEKKLGELDEKFSNQKAILDNMMVIVSASNGKKGVINYTTNEEILGFQYDDITYISTKESFLIEKDDKVGIIGSDRIVRIKPQYDNLILIDARNGLYLAEDNRFGVIDENGNTMIYLENDKIGVDINSFKSNGLKSGYVLLGCLIPVQKDGKWIFYKIETSKDSDGNKHVQCIRLDNGDFDGIGCITSVTRGTTSNLMVIEDYNILVVEKYDQYGFMDLNGRPTGLVYKDTYLETTSGLTNYYAVDKNGNIINVIEELEKRGYTKVQK